MDLVLGVEPAISSYVDMIWYSRTEHVGSFLSTAATSWELVITTVDGTTNVTVRGPETRASVADFPAGAEYLGITFKLGTFMPHLPLQTLLDREDATLPAASGTSFWLHGSAWELPSHDNAGVFVDRLIRRGILVRDPLVEAALEGRTPDISLRSLQYHFVRATGLTYKTIQQIERANSARLLLEQGTPILDTAFKLGYFDQAHLTNSLRRFVGKTPAQVAQPG